MDPQEQAQCVGVVLWHVLDAVGDQRERHPAGRRRQRVGERGQLGAAARPRRAPQPRPVGRVGRGSRQPSGSVSIRPHPATAIASAVSSSSSSSSSSASLSFQPSRTTAAPSSGAVRRACSRTAVLPSRPRR
ncbi:hypothetical protein [Streptomyces sp. NPDC047042]|uniref:hypothetical protein n=1 Tax=Streptomyces sp. NPDC047042 TaxID=3154807 RepID=UPI0033E493A0